MLDYGPTLNLLLFLTQIIHNGSICIVYVILCYVMFVSFTGFLKVDYISTLAKDQGRD